MRRFILVRCLRPSASQWMLACVSLGDPIMKYRILGRPRFEVSGIAYGLWGMSGWTGSNDDESLKALQLSVDLGCNFFDTAWAYGEGKSDGLLGEILQCE